MLRWLLVRLKADTTATAIAFALMLLAQPAWAQTETAVRAAITRALPLLQRSAATFAAERACVSCHHNSLTVITLRQLQHSGFPVDSKVLGAVENRTFRELRGARALDEAIQAVSLADPTPNESYLLMAAHAAGLPRDLTTAVYARRMARWQHDGHWVTSDFRPPHSSSDFTATATAIRAVALYMPDERHDERDATIDRARQWLLTTMPTSTEDASFRLLGLVWAGASADARRVAARICSPFSIHAEDSRSSPATSQMPTPLVKRSTPCINREYRPPIPRGARGSPTSCRRKLATGRGACARA